MKRFLVSASASALIVVAAFAGVKTYDTYAFAPADLANGKMQYAAHCMNCHGAQGHGDGITAADLQVSADNIWEELSNPFGFKQELIQSVYTGDNGQNGQMPAFQGILSKRDISDALEYVRSVND